MSYEEGEGYVLGPSPIGDAAIWFVIVLAFVVPMAMFGLGYSAGHNAATAAFHGESSHD